MDVNIPNIQQWQEPAQVLLQPQQVIEENNGKKAKIDAKMRIAKSAVSSFAILAITGAAAAIMPVGIAPLAITGAAYLACIVAYKILKNKQGYLKKIVDIAANVFGLLALYCAATVMSFGAMPLIVVGVVSLVSSKCLDAFGIFKNKIMFVPHGHLIMKVINNLAVAVFTVSTICLSSAMVIISAGVVLLTVEGVVSLVSLVAAGILKYKQCCLKKEVLTIIEKNSNDRDIVLAAVRQNSELLRFASDDLKNSRELMLEVVKHNGEALQYVPDALKNSEEFMLEVVKHNGEVLQYVPDALKNSRELMLAAVQLNGWALQYVPDAFKDDKDVVLAAVRQQGLALQYASDALKNDKDIVLAAVRQEGFALQYASKPLKKDRGFMLAAVQLNGWALLYVPDAFKYDRKFMLAAVQLNGEALQYVPDAFKDDKDVVLAAVRQNSEALRFASDALKNSRELMLEVVKHNGKALQYVPDAFKNDKEVVLAAVIQNSDALQFVSLELQDWTSKQIGVRKESKSVINKRKETANTLLSKIQKNRELKKNISLQQGEFKSIINLPCLYLEIGVE